jgi:hypothetical protein
MPKITRTAPFTIAITDSLRRLRLAQSSAVMPSHSTARGQSHGLSLGTCAHRRSIFQMPSCATISVHGLTRGIVPEYVEIAPRRSRMRLPTA